MSRSLHPWNKKLTAIAFYKLYQPAQNILPDMPKLKARGDRPLQMEFEDQLKALISFSSRRTHFSTAPFAGA